MSKRCTHFVGFRDTAQVARARAVFGPPDFWHRFWDRRAVDDVAPGDVVVFADADERQPVRTYSFDDSSVF